MNSVRLWRAVGAHSSVKQSVNLQVYPANTLELTFYFRCRVTAKWHCPRVYEILYTRRPFPVSVPMCVCAYAIAIFTNYVVYTFDLLLLKSFFFFFFFKGPSH